MKATTIKKAHMLIQEEAPDSNTMVAVCESNENISVSFLGEPGKIGKALYAAMHDDEQPQMAAQTYLMLKDIVYNIINEKSSFSKDMLDMVLQSFENGAYEEADMTPFPITGEA